VATVTGQPAADVTRGGAPAQHSADLAAIAAAVFGYRALRPGQLEAAAALAAGRDCLVVMPSGAGKSAIYQIAAMALRRPAVIVSPLLSLQRDQARRLRSAGLPALAVNSATRSAGRERGFALLRRAAPGFCSSPPNSWHATTCSRC
jgi:ATP-dependent DNA helicase RecQ